MSNFRDYFSEQAKDYAQHRPGYPEALFDYLASSAPSRDLAWDCGTGSGQAALSLGQRFERVIATDASHKQIANASPHARVDYRVERAEHTSIPSHSVDLTTVGVAVHWFEFDPFYKEVRRVSKSGAILAAWTYHLPAITPLVDAVMEELYWEKLGDYWPERMHYLDEGYRTLPFPFEEIQPPEFKIQAQWTLHNLVGFISSWSAARKYIDEIGSSGLEKLLSDLHRAWGDPDEKRDVVWQLFLRIGRVNTGSPDHDPIGKTPKSG